MHCPTCGNRLAVLATRGVVRTRACAEGHKWETEEVIRREVTRHPELTPSAVSVLAVMTTESVKTAQLRQQLPALRDSTINRALLLLIDTGRVYRPGRGLYALGPAPCTVADLGAHWRI